MGFSRTSPSPRYLALIQQYRQLHTEGATAQGLSAQETFPGQSLPEHAPAICELIAETQANSLIDYGCGKGLQYDLRDVTLPGGAIASSISAYWGDPKIVLYDPGYPPLSTRPSEPAGGVICTDVLEHCPEEDMEWIVDDLFSLANRFVFANIASYPAAKTLPSGENAHCTVREPQWWRALIADVAAHHPNVRYLFLVEERTRTGLLRQKRGKKTTPLRGGPALA